MRKVLMGAVLMAALGVALLIDGYETAADEASFWTDVRRRNAAITTGAVLMQRGDALPAESNDPLECTRSVRRQHRMHSHSMMKVASVQSTRGSRGERRRV